MCLRKDHISRNCSAKFKCHNCKGRHHVSICPANLSPLQPTKPETPVPTPGPQQQCLTAQTASNSVVFHTDSTTPVFLQTAQAVVYNPQQPEVKVRARIILDSGSQRTYLTNNLKNILQLPTLEKKQVSIKTFGSTVERLELVEVVALGVELNGEPDLSLSAFTLPQICQLVELAVKNNPCHLGLKLADFCTEGEALGVDIYYWKLVTSHTIKGVQGPTAVHTRRGLSGPVCLRSVENQQRSNLVTSNLVKCLMMVFRES